MQQTIAVVHGGTSAEREKSLKYGKHVSKILTELGMDVLELHLHPNGSWTVNGKVENVEQALGKVHKVWNCLVGVDGERGTVEKLCEKCKTKIVGHTSLHSHLVADKKNLHLLLAQHQIKSPHGKIVYKKDFTAESVKEVFAKVSMPAVVKPLVGSGMLGMNVVQNFNELKEAVENLIANNQDVLVEKLIVGVPVSCFVFEHNNLLHTSIKVHDNSELGRDDLMNIRNDALYIHSVLAYPHHAEYDFVLVTKNGKKEIYFLETNSHPSLSTGYIADSFKNGVVNFKDYIHHKVFG